MLDSPLYLIPYLYLMGNIDIKSQWSDTVEVWPVTREIINKFCMDNYEKLCNRFSTYVDWEPYWVCSGVQIPISTVISYNQKPNGEIKVNSNWRLMFISK